ncbi:MAG: hypothetical protein NT120_01295, partial [Candidatus Aenigmarchaeota archaeon]|nr:hypothetical protein [Candidatus Aenigmarchaeota archaeon]
MKTDSGTNWKPEYYRLLTYVGRMVDRCVADFYESSVYPGFPEKEILYKKMLDRKKGTQKLRAMAAYLAFSVFKGENALDDDKVKRIISAVELENWSNYELNWLFDGKANTKSLLEVKEAGLATHGFFNDALKIISDMP